MIEKTIEKNQQKVINYFNGLLKKYGDSPKSLAYGSRETQMKKFKVLAEIGDINGATILDVGCGFGEFYDYLSEKNHQIAYHGCDISAQIIEVAKKKNPHLVFETTEILEWDNSKKFDYVVSTGFNCVKTSSNWKLLKLMIHKMFSLCNNGVAIGMTSSFKIKKDPITYYADPIKTLKFCSTITHKLVMRHDYLPHDFTIYLYR